MAFDRIWLTDMAAQLPEHARLDGCDISSAHFPPKNELPTNANLFTHDVLRPFSEDLHGQYDVVHIGRINLTVRNNDPGPVLKNVTQLLSMYRGSVGRSNSSSSSFEARLTLNRARRISAMGRPRQQRYTQRET